MFGISGFELIIIILFLFLVFGPDKLPSMARTIGRAIARFRDAQQTMSETLNASSFVDINSDEPFKNPIDVLENAARKVSGDVGSVAGDTKNKTAKATPASKAGAASGGESSRPLTFAERKAKYEAERKERLAKEAEQKASEAAAHKDDPKTEVSEKQVQEAKG